MLKKILVPLDGSSLAERALPYAMRLTRASGGCLSLLHIRLTHLDLDEPPYDPETVARRLRADGVDVEVLTQDTGAGTTGSAIANAARRQHADLIVMSPHGRTGPGRWFYGGVAEETLRRADVPIVMVPVTCERTWPTDHAFRILVALDGSDLAERALGPAAELASALKATLLLFRATDSREHPYAAGHTYVTSDATPELEEVRTYLKSIAERLRATGHHVEVHVVLGTPSRAIVAVASEQDVDLVVMRTHGHDDRRHLVLGDVATGTLVRSTLPVMFVRSVAMYRPAVEPGAPVDVSLSPSELDLVKHALAQLLLPELDPDRAEPAQTLLARLERIEATAGVR